ncbi:MAG: hypothetical protein HY342_13320 [Candidatus Lambdaproteobacteria bacterium]|nr:hypothetical protein [Candidatus Lambdaproteobacteria bacterium]
MTMFTPFSDVNDETLVQGVRSAAAAAGLDAQETATALARRDYFALLERLVQRRSAGTPMPAEMQRHLETLLRRKAFAHPATTGERPVEPVVFGTGGHRGVIGEGLTLVHVRAIVESLLQRIAGMAPDERARHFGHAKLEAVKAAGFIVGHDNRLFNPDFACYAMHLLTAAGYRVAYAGRVATPELSLVVPRQGWAGSLNFTPSHNPFRYGGIKLSPADGGLAGGDITDALAAEANTRLRGIRPADWPARGELERQVSGMAARVQHIDVHRPYLDALAENPVIRLDELAAELCDAPPAESLHLVADPTWGGAVPVYLALRDRLGPAHLTVLHTEDDAYFGGQTTEPNAQTLSDALHVLEGIRSGFGVAIRNDPDCDRGLVGDLGGAIKMNRFAVLVARYLLDLGQHGALVTTHATSHFGPDFARTRGMPVHITAVGFKNFRPLLQSGEALVAYEESDGLTIAGHTLDKDGVLDGLLACRMVRHYRRPLHELLAQAEAETGHYHWTSVNFPIDMPAAEAHLRLRPLANVRPGQAVHGAGLRRTVAQVNAEDGYKFVFDDDTWLMIRPSGTEPKIRVYGETKLDAAASEALCKLGQAMALEALGHKR